MKAPFVKNISNQVYEKFPEVKGLEPDVKPQQTASAKTLGTEPTFLFTYTVMAKQPNGKSFPRQIRVIADGSGKIIKMSTSR